MMGEAIERNAMSKTKMDEVAGGKMSFIFCAWQFGCRYDFGEPSHHHEDYGERQAHLISTSKTSLHTIKIEKLSLLYSLARTPQD
jgi:hypothetical protein